VRKLSGIVPVNEHEWRLDHDDEYAREYFARRRLVNSWARHMRVPWWSPWWALFCVLAKRLAIGTYIVATLYLASLVFSVCSAAPPSSESARSDAGSNGGGAVRADAHGRGPLPTTGGVRAGDPGRVPAVAIPSSSGVPRTALSP
jgi:hypothetical protein